MTITERLGVRDGEGRLVLMVLTIFFCAGLARAFAGSGVYSMFLARFGGEMLPYVYVVTGVIMAALMYGFLRLSERLSLARIVTLNFGIGIVGSIAMPLALAVNQSAWLVFAATIWYECLVVMLPAAIWSIAGELLTVRQGKRLFGLIGTGIPLGFIVSGLLTPLFVRTIGPANLLLLTAAAIAAALAASLLVLRTFPTVGAEPQGAERSRKAPPTENLWRNQYVRLIFGLLACWTVSFFIVDNIFYERVGVRFANEVAIASFMGIYVTTRGVIMVICGLLVTGPFLARFGVRIGNLALPIALALGITPLVLVGAVAGPIAWLFWPAYATKLLHYAADSIDRSSLSILYQPLPAALRQRVPMVAEGVLLPVMTAAAGLLLLALTNILGFNVVQLGFVLVIVLAAWLLIALALGRQYKAVLMQALVRRRLNDERLVLGDESSRAVLQQAMLSPKADVVLYATNRLEAAGDPSLDDWLAKLLDHPAHEVRCAAAALIERRAPLPVLLIVKQRLATETVPQVRSALLRAYAAIDPEEAFDAIAPALSDVNPTVREGAAIGLMRHAGIGGVLAVGQEVLRWVGSPLPAARASAARVLSEVGDHHYYQPLAPLLADPNIEVQRAAIEAAGRLRSPRLWPILLDKLGDSATGQASVAALAHAGDTVLPLVDAALRRPHRAVADRIRLVQVGGRLRTPAAGAMLMGHIGEPQPQVRSAVLHALHRCNYQATGEDVRQVQAQIQAEADNAAWTLVAFVELEKVEGADLLYSALNAEFAYMRKRVLDLLALVAPANSVRRAQDVLGAARATAEQRAYALEALDIVTPQELKPVIMALVDDIAPLQRQQRLTALFPQPAMNRSERVCAAIVDGGDRFNSWTQACAIDAAARLRLHSLRGVVADAARSPDPLLAETAAWVLTRMDGSGLPPAREGGQRVKAREEVCMLSIVERVIILKTVNIFTTVPDDTLAAVAGVLEEVEVGAGMPIFQKGDLGQAMYIIVAGSVRIHDGDQTINRLVTYDVFGEMALLDAEPRSASVSAEEDTLLLRLQQEDFFDLFEDHSAIARGIIQVLLRRLRDRSEEIAGLRRSAAQ